MIGSIQSEGARRMQRVACEIKNNRLIYPFLPVISVLFTGHPMPNSLYFMPNGLADRGVLRNSIQSLINKMQSFEIAEKRAFPEHQAPRRAECSFPQTNRYAVIREGGFAGDGELGAVGKDRFGIGQALPAVLFERRHQ